MPYCPICLLQLPSTWRQLQQFPTPASYSLLNYYCSQVFPQLQGLYLEITGPTLIDLKLRTHSNYEAVATAVSGRSAGFFIGAVLGGLLVDKLGAYCDLLVALSLNGGAAATVILPWVHITDLLFFITLCQGTFEGVINIGKY